MNPVIRAIDANIRAIELLDENVKLRATLGAIARDCEYVLESRELSGYRVERFVKMILGRVNATLAPSANTRGPVAGED